MTEHAITIAEHGAKAGAVFVSCSCGWGRKWPTTFQVARHAASGHLHNVGVTA